MLGFSARREILSANNENRSLKNESDAREFVRSHRPGASQGAGERTILRSVRDSDDKLVVCSWSYFKHSLESLILAQDERWRRA